MSIVVVLLSFFLSIFSTTVLLYISIATYIGPWIAPTLALIGVIVARCMPRVLPGSMPLVYATSAGSLGGIMATAVGFSYPTLYFLDKDFFMQLYQSPLYFSAVLGGLTLTAGFFGLWIADTHEQDLLVQQKLPFPIGEMAAKIIVAQKSIAQGYELLAGFASSLFFSMMQRGTGITLMRSYAVGPFITPVFYIMLSPFLWAIGFITGRLIAQPLIIGAVARYLCIDPVSRIFFTYLTNDNFVLAFCSGMVLYGAVCSFWYLPSMVHKGFAGYKKKRAVLTGEKFFLTIPKVRMATFLALCMGTISFLSWLDFSFISQLYLLSTSYLCTYNIAVIAGKMGLAPLGRFATFVMVPALFLFKLNNFQYVCIATFVEIAGGVAADVLSGRKMGQECAVPSDRIRLFQILGIVISSLVMGVLLWFFLQRFSLGSPDFFAGRAQSRALLMSVTYFDYSVLLLGMMFSGILQYFKANPLLVLGGILMPLNYSLGLIIGACGSFCVRNPDRWAPFWSGVFAAGSIWMLIQVFINR